jgi:hypothetical protein
MLTEEQREKRRGRLTASRIGILVSGDADAVYSLWAQMRGQEPEDDLRDVWAVRLGEATEQLNLEWYERTFKRALSNHGTVVVHPREPWAATLDAWDAAVSCPIEAKHVGGREPLEKIINRYYPQCTWQMGMTGASQCALSVIMGADKPVVEFIPFDIPYANELKLRARQFMVHVIAGTEPVVRPPPPLPVIPIKDYDMSTSNEWCNHAVIWLENVVQARLAKDAEASLKALVPDDALSCTGAGVQIKRNRAGSLSLKQEKSK